MKSKKYFVQSFVRLSNYQPDFIYIKKLNLVYLNLKAILQVLSDDAPLYSPRF